MNKNARSLLPMNAGISHSNSPSQLLVQQKLPNSSTSEISMPAHKERAGFWPIFKKSKLDSCERNPCQSKSKGLALLINILL